jgi:hypothetical protein
MRDGTLYAGVSPDTGKAMYATPMDAPLSYTFNEAQEYAENLDAYSFAWLNVIVRDASAAATYIDVFVSGEMPASIVPSGISSPTAGSTGAASTWPPACRVPANFATTFPWTSGRAGGCF